MENEPKVGKVKGPEAAVAGFIRPRDKERIWVYTKKGESTDAAIKRVMAKNGASGQSYDLCVK